MPTVLLRLVADAALVAVCLFASAGTLRWGRAWVLVAVLLAVRTVSAVLVSRVNPALVRDRARLPVHRDQPAADRLLLLSVLATGFVGVPVVAGLDVFRWHLLPRPAAVVADLGLPLFAAGWAIKGLALRENAFATTVVRVQHERGHALVDTGVYRIVRHPFYAGTLLVLTGMGLWLESYAAVLFAALPIALVVIRLLGEERLLRRDLPGYAEYEARVPHRLVPRVW